MRHHFGLRNSVAPAVDRDYWIQRARMTRAKAAIVHDAKLKERLRRVAVEYERLAACVAQQSGTTASVSRAGDADDEQLSLAL